MVFSLPLITTSEKMRSEKNEADKTIKQVKYWENRSLNRLLSNPTIAAPSNGKKTAPK
tara:strand:+ start:223 stop:396 length:174 start_codon:yes stop_codon:yes gene_type:complete